MRPGTSWVSAPTVNDDRNLQDGNHVDELTREVVALAVNVGDIAADVTVTLIPPTIAEGRRVEPRSVRIEPGVVKLMATTTGSVRLESTQPIVPGGETRVLHNGTTDVLTRLYSAAPLVWFELTPERVEPPAPIPDRTTRRVAR